MPGDVSLDVIATRLDDLRTEVRDMSKGFVRADLYESQRTDSGRRTGEVERDVTELRVELNGIKTESERRYRTSVNLALGAFLSFLGGAGLLIIQLVAK